MTRIIKDTIGPDKSFREKRPSLEDIARIVGVSKSTVSHVLNNTKQISFPVRERILETVKKLDYTPNFFGRALARKKSGTIGLLISSTTNYFAYLYLQHYAELLAGRELGLSIHITMGQARLAEKYLDAFRSGQADGVIVLTKDVSQESLLRAAHSGYPVTCPNIILPDHEAKAAIKMDDYEAMVRIVRLLCDMGHRNIAFICGHLQEEVIAVRKKAFEDVMASCGRPVEPSMIISDIEAMDEAQSASLSILRRNPGLTAFVCSNDNLALGVIGALKSKGIKIPQEISVTGFDDLPLASLMTPTLTTVSFDYRKIAEAVVDNLMDQINSCSSRPIKMIPMNLVVRDSTGPVNIDQKNNFISPVGNSES